MNGYINVEILGKNRGLKFGMLATQQIMLEVARLNKQLGNEVDIAVIPVVVYWGLFNNCYVKREDPDFTFEQVCDWMDDNSDKMGLFAEIMQTFYDSKLIKDSIETEEKKSMISPQVKDGISSEVSVPEKSEFIAMTD